MDDSIWVNIKIKSTKLMIKKGWHEFHRDNYISSNVGGQFTKNFAITSDEGFTRMNECLSIHGEESKKYFQGRSVYGDQYKMVVTTIRCQNIKLLLYIVKTKYCIKSYFICYLFIFLWLWKRMYKNLFIKRTYIKCLFNAEGVMVCMKNSKPIT